MSQEHDGKTVAYTEFYSTMTLTWIFILVLMTRQLSADLTDAMNIILWTCSLVGTLNFAYWTWRTRSKTVNK
jgi:hypothetical protein